MYQFIEIVSSQLTQLIVEVGGPVIQEKVGDAIDLAIKNSKDFFKSFNMKAHNKAYDIDVLEKKGLIKIAKECMVSGSNEVIVTKKTHKNQYIVYLSYMKDKELIPIEKNIYLIIRSKAITPDILDLFGSEQYIILK